VKDKYGRTPVDVIKEKAENGPQREAALRAMSRAKRTTLQLIEAVRQENAETVLSMKQEASNERMASQRIIVRLEEELEKTNKDLEEIESKKRDGEGSVSQLKQEVAKLQAEREKERQLALSVKRERDDLMDQNEVLQNQIQEHENVVKALHQEFEDERQGRSDSVAKLKSELSTAKAMAEALESQLRSRFTNEEYLTNTVSELETQIADLNSEFQQKKTKLMNERDAYENENTQLKRNVDDLSKKSASLQAKLTEVNRQMSAVLSSHGALNAEHDRIIDSTLRTEAELIEATRTERAEMLAMIRKQWEFFESSVKEQEQMLEDFQQKEINMLEMAKEERDRSFEMISNMRQDFRDARVSAMDRQRTLQTDTLVSPISNGLKTSSSDSVKSKPQSVGHSASSSQQTRRTHARGSSDQSNSRKELISTGISKSMSSSTYTARSGRQELPPPRPVESRLPASTEMSSGEKRQDHMESNLLHLLESRADQGSGRHRRGFSATESTSYGTSGASSSSALGPRQRVIATDASTAASSSSSPAARPTSNAPRITTKPLRKSHSLSLDEYSQASSVSIDESDDDVSSRPSRNTKPSNQYSGMTTGMRLGTIRISEEASELDSRYSRQ
jgi:myosin heavy subunit